MAMTQQDRAAFEELRRQRDEALRQLKALQNTNPSPVYVELVDVEAPGLQFNRHFIHARRIVFEYKGVCLRVSVVDDHISVRYHDTQREANHVVMTPVGFQCLEFRNGAHARFVQPSKEENA